MLRNYCIVQTNNPTKRAPLHSYDPTQISTIYGFPLGYDGTGQTIGIIQLGGGYILSDITTYLQNLGITTIPKITDVLVNGAQNNPLDTSGAKFEVYLDIEIICSIVPKSNIRVYFAPNSYNGFYNAINAAVLQKCNIISISWGAPESYWSKSDLDRFNNLFQRATSQNITVFCASGDSGAYDGTPNISVDFPASSPYVVACGGTTLTLDEKSNFTEITWNNDPTTSSTGGGISNYFSKPTYQNNVQVLRNYTKRALPDVSGNADPNTGYNIFIEGKTYVIGGTSAVSPLWSALTCRINQKSGSSVGLLQNKIYSSSNLCTDIISGNNGVYYANVGFDLCTGWGTPNSNLITYLMTGLYTCFSVNTYVGSSPLTIRFTDISTNNPTSWNWDFGDGTTSSLRNPTHIFSNVGIYNVKLTTDKNYFTNTIQVIKPTTSSVVRPPVTNFSISSIQFRDTSTNNPTSWNWDFGDGTTSTEQNPTHTYPKLGTYSIKLTSRNSVGSSNYTTSITLR